jgi:hypothetical protein
MYKLFTWLSKETASGEVLLGFGFYSQFISLKSANNVLYEWGNNIERPVQH